MKRFVKRSWHWIALILFTDIVFLFVVWIIRREAVKYMSLFLFLYTVLAFAAGIFIEFYHQHQDNTALKNFLDTPDGQAKENFLSRFESCKAAEMLCTQFLLELSLVNEKTVELKEYQEYIESWVHEVKTPLSLFTLILNNHREEMSPYVYSRFHYIQRQLSEDVERILYYARLSADHSDIKFTHFRLDECVSEAVFEYQVFMEERGILLSFDLYEAEIVSDRKVVLFMISQLMSNAVKYTDSKDGKVSVSMSSDKDKIHLGIYNNGEGVPPEDVPFIFDKGFTGNYPNRQKATGMGLYLVRKYAEKLCVVVQLNGKIPYGEGFGIELIFTL